MQVSNSLNGPGGTALGKAGRASADFAENPKMENLLCTDSDLPHVTEFAWIDDAPVMFRVAYRDCVFLIPETFRGVAMLKGEILKENFRHGPVPNPKPAIPAAIEFKLRRGERLQGSSHPSDVPYIQATAPLPIAGANFLLGLILCQHS